MGSSRRWMKLISIGKNRSSLNKGETKKAQIWKPWKSLSSFSKRFTLYRRDQGLAHFTKNGIAQEESAAIAIQTAFRVFLAKRALRALKGLVRLEVAITGHEIRNQSAVNVPSIQAFVRVQARIRRQQAAKNRDALGLPQQNSSTFAVEISPGDSEMEWCSSLGTIEELQAKEHQRHLAAINRERAIAYAFCNKWKANRKVNPGSLFDYDHNNSTWVWIWLDEWLNGEQKKAAVLCGEIQRSTKKATSQSGEIQKSIQKVKETAHVKKVPRKIGPVMQTQKNLKVNAGKSNEHRRMVTRRGSPSRFRLARSSLGGKGKGIKMLSPKSEVHLKSEIPLET